MPKRTRYGTGNVFSIKSKGSCSKFWLSWNINWWKVLPKLFLLNQIFSLHQIFLLFMKCSCFSTWDGINLIYMKASCYIVWGAPFLRGIIFVIVGRAWDSKCDGGTPTRVGLYEIESRVFQSGLLGKRVNSTGILIF